MEVFHRLHYLDSFEGLIVTLGLLLTAYTIRKDERARQVSNPIAIYERYDRLWSMLFEHPQRSRILKPVVDINQQPVSYNVAVLGVMFWPSKAV